MLALCFAVRSKRLLPASAALALALGACADDPAAPGAGLSTGAANGSTADASATGSFPATAGGGAPTGNPPAADAGSIVSPPAGGGSVVADSGVVVTPGGGTGVPGPSPDSGVAQAGAGSASEWPSDCEMRHVFRAHNNNGVSDTSKKHVAAGAQYYASYYYRPPWGAREVQGLKFHTIIDNKRIVHHWILYGVNSGATQQDGEVQGGQGQPIGSMQGEFYIAGWAPGAPDIVLPDGVGLHMATGANAMFRLEVHYFNIAAGSVEEEDASGVEFCVTSKKRPAEAAIHWMGTTNLNVLPGKSDVNASCRPQITNGPVHLISLSSHMHKTGVHSKAILKRANGGPALTLIDDAFSFLEQAGYKQPRDGSAADVLINAGDTIDVQCTFDNQTGTPKRFGSNTEDEMCFFYAMAWPRGQLQNGSWFSIVPGAEPEVNCIE
jgi:Copper type II ascorbate-dependent monooxygenase, C-terminal domain/Copper type II ascorbate-dependent monooxygenase, N-terminal domain